MSDDKQDIVEVYSARDPQEAALVANALQDAGLNAKVVGNMLQSAGGEIPLGYSTSPRVWVSTADLSAALVIVRDWEREIYKDQLLTEKREWTCPNCETQLADNFAICWNCGSDRTGNIITEIDLASLDQAEEEVSEPPNWRVRLTLIAFLTLVASGLLWLWVQPRTYLDFWRRGNDAYMGGDDDLAIQEFTAAIQEGPEDPGGYRGRGYAYTSKQEWSRALDDIDIAIDIDPTYYADYFFRGRCLSSLGRYKEALRDYERSIELGRNEENLNALAWFLATCPRSDFRHGSRAVELAQEACEATKNKQWDMLDTLAAAYAQNGEFKKAVTTIQEVIELAPESEKAESVRCLELYLQGKTYVAADSDEDSG